MTFAGGREFPGAAFGPPGLFPDVIYTINLTPHATGTMGRTVEQIKQTLLLGVDPGGEGVCPPMPVGPMGAFGGLTDGDATDIATYVLALPPIENTIPNGCQAPPGPPPAKMAPGPMRARRAFAR